MGRYKYLFKNIGLLTLSSFGTKLLSFFLVPLYTKILTTAQYGAYDMFNTTIGVLIPILTLNIQESVLRFALDKHYRRDAIVTVATRFLLLGSGLVLAGLTVNAVFSFSALVGPTACISSSCIFLRSFPGWCWPISGASTKSRPCPFPAFSAPWSRWG